ncbi:hypothetical protein ACFWGU_23425, partial [Streptomyces goshikiensis]
MNGPGAEGAGVEGGPADLRLVAPAVAAWVAAALALDAPAGWTAAGVGLGGRAPRDAAGRLDHPEHRARH